MVSFKDNKLDYLIIITVVFALCSNITSSPSPLAKQHPPANQPSPLARQNLPANQPSPLAKQNLPAKQTEVDLGYNSTAPEGVNEIVRIVVNLVKVSRPRLLQLQGNASNVTKPRAPIPIPDDDGDNYTTTNLTATTGTHDNITGGPSMVGHLFNSTTHVDEILMSSLESFSLEEHLTCDVLQKEVFDLIELEAAIMQLLDATRKRARELKNATMENLHQNCFPDGNKTLHNNTIANVTTTSFMNTSGGIEVDITEPVTSIRSNDTKAESRDHKRQSLQEFTDLVTTLINALQGMGQNVMMTQQVPSKGTNADNAPKGPGTIDMVCGDTLKKPSTMAEYVMGKHRRR